MNTSRYIHLVPSQRNFQINLFEQKILLRTSLRRVLSAPLITQVRPNHELIVIRKDVRSLADDSIHLSAHSTKDSDYARSIKVGPFGVSLDRLGLGLGPCYNSFFAA